MEKGKFKDLIPVFVYGTLKKGFSNHFLLEKSLFLGNAESVEKYALYIGEYPVVNEYEKVSTIKGEVYLVDLETLEKLDILEECPEYYYRKMIKVKLHENGEIINAYIYFNNIEKWKLELSGKFE